MTARTLAATPAPIAVDPAAVALRRSLMPGAMPVDVAFVAVDAVLIAARIWVAVPGEYIVTPLPVEITAVDIAINPTDWIRFTIAPECRHYIVAPEVRHWTSRTS